MYNKSIYVKHFKTKGYKISSLLQSKGDNLFLQQSKGDNSILFSVREISWFFTQFKIIEKQKGIKWST